MIEFLKGNILTADAEAVVNTVNCVGVMGKGIALQFKQAYPDNYEKYRDACDAGELIPGKMFVTETGRMMNPRVIINFPTKRHWKGKSRISDIEDGLIALTAEIENRSIRSIAVPPLGCGNGGLDWNDVKPLIESALSGIPNLKVFQFEPVGMPDVETMPIGTKAPVMTKARAAFVKLIGQYAVPGYRLSMLEIQKLAYFLQSAGEDLNLGFRRNIYGPYAEDLHVPLQRMEGHFIRGYGDRSREAQLHVLDGAAERADAFLVDHPDTAGRLERVSELIKGFENPHGMELLATVHWIFHNTKTPVSETKAIKLVHAWSERKRLLFPRVHIKMAYRRLSAQGWLDKTFA